MVRVRLKEKKERVNGVYMLFPHFPPLPSDEYMYIAVHYAICERERGWKIYTY